MGRLEKPGIDTIQESLRSAAILLKKYYLSSFVSDLAFALWSASRAYDKMCR
jgi:hypothetical protein